MITATTSLSPVQHEYLTVSQVAKMLSCTARTIWKFSAAGKMPKPLYLSARMPRWKRSEVMEHLEALAAQRN